MAYFMQNGKSVNIKTKFQGDSAQVAHIWAQRGIDQIPAAQRQDFIHPRTGINEPEYIEFESNNTSTSGRFYRSYSTNIAVWVKVQKQWIALIDNSHYSQTTNGHQSDLIRAIPGSNSYFLIYENRVSNLKDIFDLINSSDKSAKAQGIKRLKDCLIKEIKGQSSELISALMNPKSKPAANEKRIQSFNSIHYQVAKLWNFCKLGSLASPEKLLEQFKNELLKERKKESDSIKSYMLSRFNTAMSKPEFKNCFAITKKALRALSGFELRELENRFDAINLALNQYEGANSYGNFWNDSALKMKPASTPLIEIKPSKQEKEFISKAALFCNFNESLKNRQGSLIRQFPNLAPYALDSVIEQFNNGDFDKAIAMQNENIESCAFIYRILSNEQIEQSKELNHWELFDFAKSIKEAREQEAREQEAKRNELLKPLASGDYSTWQNHELEHSIPYALQTDSNGSAIMRINQAGDSLETTRGAKVPLYHAIKIFRLVEIAIKKNENIELKHGQGPRVGFYHLDKVDIENKKMIAGCHEFSFDRIFEVAQIAKARGLME